MRETDRQTDRGRQIDRGRDREEERERIQIRLLFTQINRSPEQTNRENDTYMKI